MKILFVTGGKKVDYLNDCILHGLVKSGHDVVDSNYCWFLSKLDKKQKSKLYGKGFTIVGNLEDRSKLNRINIENRIKDKEFDLIVYGSIWRCLDYLDIVTKIYPRNRIVFCDGEDHQTIIQDLIPKGIYFKRELVSCNSEVHPIQFAIPEEKIATTFLQKTKELAYITPKDRRTYIYSDEKSYYADYNSSKFGLTMKKSGWDCMRHYEIIANHCLPYFEDFHYCPKMTMIWWPKDLQNMANAMYENKLFENYDTVLRMFFDYCKEKLTTKYLVKYIIETVFNQ